MNDLKINDSPDAPCNMPCHKCIALHDIKAPGIPMFALDAVRMILCDSCGNKRCPHASDHNLQCTNSNETGQEGSMYGNIGPYTKKLVSLTKKFIRDGGLNNEV